MTEVSRTFTCFGGATTVAVEGPARRGARAGGSEDDRPASRPARDVLPVQAGERAFGPEQRRAGTGAGQCDHGPVRAGGAGCAAATGGLVDFTFLNEIEAAGYREDRFRGTLSLVLALALGPPRSARRRRAGGRWRQVRWTSGRTPSPGPSGMRFDGGGIVKGMAADHGGRAAGRPPRLCRRLRGRHARGWDRGGGDGC